MTHRLSCLLALLGGLTALLADSQQTDPRAWTPIQIPGRQPAPEFADITAWINSKPLEMSELKGKVVVVHFPAFG